MEKRNHSGGFSLDPGVVRGDHGSDALGVASEAQSRGQKRRTPVEGSGGRKVEQEGPSWCEEDRRERGEKDRDQKRKGRSRRTRGGRRDREGQRGTGRESR